MNSSRNLRPLRPHAAGGLPGCAVAFAAGVALLQQQAVLPGLLWWYPLLAAGFVSALAGRTQGNGRQLAAWAWLPILGAAGFVLAATWAHVRLDQRLDPAWEGRDARVTGVVVDLPQMGERGVRFLFDVEGAATPSAQLPGRVSLTWYADAAGAGPGVPLQPGQRWEFTVRLRRPHGSANPHGFDFEVWALERGIRAVGYVRVQEPAQLVAGMVHAPAYWIERLRGAARARIQRALAGDAQAGVLTALAIGDQQAIDAAQWTVFTRTGVNHLMSISGLHVTMVAALVFALVLRVWSRLEPLALRLPAQKAAVVIGLGAGIAYALLSGFGVPAQRTIYMLAVVALALALGRPIRSRDVLALALMTVLALDPWAILAPGFWLSFGAVALILYAGAGRMERAGPLRTWWRVQWAITLGLVPLLLALFQQISIVSPLANALAVPLIGLGVVPLTLLGTLLPLDVVLRIAAWLMHWCDVFLVALSSLPAAVWQQHAPPSWALAVALPGLAWLLAPRGFPARWVGAAALLPLFLLPAPRPAAGHFWADVLDVGQGLAVVIRTAQHALLFDAGAAFSQDTDSGSRIIVPHLRAIGVGRLDTFVVSHDDADHTGGMHSVLAALPVSRVTSSLADTNPRLRAVAAVSRCQAGMQWEWDGVRFGLLHPTPESYNQDEVKDNDRSCVLHVASVAGSLLIPADIERGAEAQLVERAGGALRADVLIVPHHGSSTSSSDAFLRAVDPGAAVFSVGYRNRFGHPAQRVVEGYAQRGIRVLRSDADGAVRLRFEDRLSIEAWRHTHARYWHAG
jgi:competence protein ComEC